MSFINYLIIINIVGFVICCMDKLLAIKHMYRVPEIILFCISFIGGCFGFYMGMNVFHHKTKKNKFKIIYFIMLLWIIIIYKMY